jgi:hypothetical protein
MKNTTNAITNALIAQGIRKIGYDEINDSVFGDRIFVTVEKKDREKAEMVLNTILTKVERCESTTTYKTNNNRIFLKPCYTEM